MREFYFINSNKINLYIDIYLDVYCIVPNVIVFKCSIDLIIYI